MIKLQALKACKRPATLLKRDSMLLLYSPWGEGKIWNIITLKIAWLWFLMLFIACYLLLGVPYCGTLISHCWFLSESRDLQGYDVSMRHKFYPLLAVSMAAAWQGITTAGLGLWAGPKAVFFCFFILNFFQSDPKPTTLVAGFFI